MRALNLILILVSLVWTLIVTALIGNIIANNNNGHMPSINFAMFVAALAWVALLIGLAAAFFSTLARPILLIPLYFWTALFSFVAAIVLAAKTRAPNCGNLRHAHLPHNWIGYGSGSDEKRCRELEASTAFMWFLWATVTAVLILAIREARRGYSGSVLSSRPTMSQVV